MSAAERLPVLTGEPAAEWVAIEALRPWKDNPRKNDGEPVRKVAESIQRFGFGAPILARRENGEIIAGHTRWKAAKKLGLYRVPVRYLDLDPADAHLLAVADNRVAAEATWDDAMLAAVLADLKAQGHEERKRFERGSRGAAGVGGRSERGRRRRPRPRSRSRRAAEGSAMRREGARVRSRMDLGVQAANAPGHAARLPSRHAASTSPARRRSARLAQYGGPRAGLRAGASVGSPRPRR